MSPPVLVTTPIFRFFVNLHMVHIKNVNLLEENVYLD
jgi:hypothetical protein